MAKQKSTVYKCRKCGYTYATKYWARRCQEWCAAHKSCNLKITKYALQK